MREDCRHFESRTYDNGEVARFCVLGLAPEQPWRCPNNCSRYEVTLIDGSFETAELARPSVEDEPDTRPTTSRAYSPTLRPSWNTPSLKRSTNSKPCKRNPHAGGNDADVARPMMSTSGLATA